MGVQLFTLENRIVTSGGAAAISELQGVEAAGIRTAAGLNGLTNSLDRNASAALNGTKGFRDLTPAYENQTRVLAQLTPATEDAGRRVEEHGNKANNANKKIKEHDETLHGLWGTLKQLAGAYFLLEGVHFAGEAIEQAANLHELSQRTGATAETLSVLMFTGRRANLTVEQLGNGFRGMAVALGNLQQGVPAAERAFAKLGFTYQDFANLSPEERFLKLAVAVGGYKDATERADIAQDMFGRAANLMLPLFEDLARDGFGKATEEAKKFHAFITGEMADGADKTLDDWNDIKDMFKGMAREVLPAMKFAVESLYQVMMKGGDLGGWKGFWAAAREDLRNTWEDLKLVAAGLAAVQGNFGPLQRLRAARTFNDVEDGSSHADAPGVPGPHVPTPDEIEAAKKARAEYIKRVMGLANMDESMRAPDKLGFQGVAATHLALRTGSVGTLSGGTFGSASPDTSFMGGSLGGDLSTLFAQGGSGKTAAGRFGILQAFREEASRQAIQLKVQFATLGQSLGMTLADGFSNALAAGMRGKNVFAALGKTVLAGIGGIFSQMGKSLMAYGITMMKLLPFLSNPFTSGPAALAAGIALTALGAALGGALHGPGGDGGSGGGDSFRDRTTNITLLPGSAGGAFAPEGKTPQVIKVFGKDDAEGQRIFGEQARATQRSRNM